MKRIAILVVMALLSLEVSARSVHYFTYSQAVRTVSYLNTQNEMMIYFGYEYELPTYVLINEIWMERVNSSYYELWVYGWDAYTGDEIYMPLDLEGVWLYSGGNMYNAAQYLRFRVDVRRPTLTWYIPPYNPYTRGVHRHGYTRTYHYDIHRHGWMPPAYTYAPSVTPPLPYYYMRHPSTPAPMPTRTWTPGNDKPAINTAEMTRDHNPSTGTQVRSSHTTGTSRTTESSRGNANTSPSNTRTTSETRGTTETRGSSTRSSSETRSTTPTRTTVEPRSSTTRDNGTTNTTRSSSTRSSDTPSTTRTTGTRSSDTPTTTRSSNTRGSETPSTTRTTGTRNNETPSTTRSTNTRSSSATPATTRSSNTRGTANTRTR